MFTAKSAGLHIETLCSIRYKKNPKVLPILPLFPYLPSFRIQFSLDRILLKNILLKS